MDTAWQAGCGGWITFHFDVVAEDKGCGQSKLRFCSIPYEKFLYYKAKIVKTIQTQLQTRMIS